MAEPQIKCFVAMPGEEVPLDEQVASAPLPVNRAGAGEEANLSFGDYFQVLEKILTRDDFAFAKNGLRQALGKNVTPSMIREWKVVAEKHGAFYHPARIEAFTDNGCAVLGVNLALSEQGQASASHEYHLLDEMGQASQHSFIPQVYGWGEASCKAQSGSDIQAVAFCCEWFQGFSEFHLSINSQSKALETIVWDNENGHFYLNPNQREILYNKIATILAYYYDPVSLRQIFPWHHAAGDFIVKAVNDFLDVRLITVRQYTSLLDIPEPDLESRIEAALFFLANLSLRIHLDRLDGTGDLTWGPENILSSVIRGVFAGLELRGQELEQEADFASTLLHIAKELPLNYWEELCFQIIEACPPQAPDYALLKANGQSHAQALVAAFSKTGNGPFFVDKGGSLL